jgi:hypothetical protein
LGLNDEAHPKWEDMRSLEDIQEDAEMAKRDPNEGREWMGHPDPNVNEAEMRQKLIDWYKQNHGQEPGDIKGQGEGGPIPGMIRRDSGGSWEYKNPFTGQWQSWNEVWKGIHGKN